MRRFQVKANLNKDWKDPGPDLLRTRANARKEIKADLEAEAGWWTRMKHGDNPWKDWKGPFERAEVLDSFDSWNPGDKTVCQWGRKESGKMDPRGAVQCRVITVQEMSGATDASDTVLALLKTAFPGGVFSGIVNCSKIPGSSSWSQHAYGAAVDYSDGGGDNQTPEYVDWASRMGRLNTAEDKNFPAWQLLGCKVKNGQRQVGTAYSPDFEWNWGGVDDSHLWHLHTSTGDQAKTGTPNCAASFSVESDPEDPGGGTT